MVFIIIFGIAWIFTTKYYVIPSNFKIMILDENNKDITIKELRTTFNTKEVAYSYGGISKIIS